jgi:hypothetical protein
MKKLNIKSVLLGLIIGIMITSYVFAGEEIVEYIFTPSPHKLFLNQQEYSNPDIKVNLFMYENRNYLPAAVFRDICLQTGIPFEFNSTTGEINIDTANIKVIKTSELIELSPQATASVLQQNPEVRDTLDADGIGTWKGKPIRLNKDYLEGKVKVELVGDNYVVTTNDNISNNINNASIDETKVTQTTTSDGITLQYKFNDKGEYDKNGKWYIAIRQIEIKYKDIFNYSTGFGFLYKNFNNNDQFNLNSDIIDKNKTLRLYNFSSKEAKPLVDNIPNFEGKYVPLDYYENYILPLLK